MVRVETSSSRARSPIVYIVGISVVDVAAAEDSAMNHPASLSYDGQPLRRSMEYLDVRVKYLPRICSRDVVKVTGIVPSYDTSCPRAIFFANASSLCPPEG